MFVTGPFLRPHNSTLSRLKPPQVKSFQRSCCSPRALDLSIHQSSISAVYKSRVNGVVISLQSTMYSNDTTSTSPESSTSSTPKVSLSYTERIKLIMKEYGTVAIIFHTAISLFSIGTCYFLVSRYNTSRSFITVQTSHTKVVNAWV